MGKLQIEHCTLVLFLMPKKWKGMWKILRHKTKDQMPWILTIGNSGFP